MTLFEIIVSVAPLMISYMAGTIVISIYAMKSWEKQGGETFLGYEMDLIAKLLEMSISDPDPDVSEMCAESITEFLIMNKDFKA